MNLSELFRDWEDRVECKSGDVIFKEREPADVMYVILDGEIELSLRGEPLGTESTGGMIGEMAMINSSVRSATATATAKTQLARMNRDQFRKLVEDNADFSLHIMTVLANRLRVANEFITRHYG